MRAIKYVLTLLIVLTVIAIVIAVGLFAWNELDFDEKIPDVVDEVLFGGSDNGGVKPSGGAEITVSTQNAGLVPELTATVIKDYFTLWYSSLCVGRSESISSLYEYQTEDFLTDKLCLDYSVGLVSISSVELRCDRAELDVVFYSADTDDLGRSRYTVLVTAELSRDGGYVRAEATEHSFTVKESMSRALIIAHTSSQDVAAYTEAVLGDILEEEGWTRSDLSYSYLEKYMESALSAALERRAAAADAIAASFAEEPVELPETEFGYDCAAAAVYAKNHIADSNPDFGSYADNSANLASQSVYAGGIPMDMQGEAAEQWKWYSERVNTRREHSGCSESWYVPRRLYEYLERNTGFGVSAVCGAAFSSCGEGDLLFLYTGGELTDVVVITGSIVGGFGTVSDFTVADDYEVPLGTLSFDDAVAVKIVGYNTVNTIE